MLNILEWGDVEIICGRIGRLSLSALHSLGQLEYVSDHAFRMPHRSCDVVQAGFIHVPTYPSPSHLCEVLSYVMAHLPTQARYETVYNITKNRVTVQATQYPENSTVLFVRLYGSGLTRLLGYPLPVHDRYFYRPEVPPDRTGAEQHDFYTNRRTTTEPPLCIESEQFSGWHYVELTPGWYAPAHRPMCTGTPLHLSTEVELSLNRLYFPRTDKVLKGYVTPHLLAFSDPSGNRHLCSIYCGQYTAESLAAALETEMTRLANRSLPGTMYTVEYSAQSRAFTFACEVRDQVTKTVRSAPFSLFLPHPSGINPFRLGFDSIPLFGRDTYTSPHTVTVPSMQSELLRPATNIYKVTEVGHQKRLRVEPIPPSPLIAVSTAYDPKTYVLKARVYSGQLPYARSHSWNALNITSMASSAVEVLRPAKGASGTNSRCNAVHWHRAGDEVVL